MSSLPPEFWPRLLHGTRGPRPRDHRDVGTRLRTAGAGVRAKDGPRAGKSNGRLALNAKTTADVPGGVPAAGARGPPRAGMCPASAPDRAAPRGSRHIGQFSAVLGIFSLPESMRRTTRVSTRPGRRSRWREVFDCEHQESQERDAVVVVEDSVATAAGRVRPPLASQRQLAARRPLASRRMLAACNGLLPRDGCWPRATASCLAMDTGCGAADLPAVLEDGGEGRVLPPEEGSDDDGGGSRPGPETRRRARREAKPQRIGATVVVVEDRVATAAGRVRPPLASQRQLAARHDLLPRIGSRPRATTSCLATAAGRVRPPLASRRMLAACEHLLPRDGWLAACDRRLAAKRLLAACDQLLAAKVSQRLLAACKPASSPGGPSIGLPPLTGSVGVSADAADAFSAVYAIERESSATPERGVSFNVRESIFVGNHAIVGIAWR